jgi:hypothetical protein
MQDWPVFLTYSFSTGNLPAGIRGYNPDLMNHIAVLVD